MRGDRDWEIGIGVGQIVRIIRLSLTPDALRLWRWGNPSIKRVWLSGRKKDRGIRDPERMDVVITVVFNIILLTLFSTISISHRRIEDKG